MINPAIRSILLLLFTALIAAPLPVQAQNAAAGPGEDSAVILIYHRFGDDRYPSTNVTLKQFNDQITELEKAKYNIVPLETIVTAFRNKVKLPPRTIAITIDDAYLSILKNAWPRLKAANFPFTLFVATEPVSRHYSGYMSWQQIRDLARDPLVTIGQHGHSHNHLIDMSPAAAAQDVATAIGIYKKQLGFVPDIFAYPYGEYSPALENILKAKGIRAAFGQFSSVASSGNDLYRLPRFAFNEKYSKMTRFRLIVNALALPVHDILPQSPIVSRNPPRPGFTVDKNIRGLSALTCYPSNMSKAADITRIGGNRIEIRFAKPLPRGRSRINCTMPGPNGRWYWLGLPFFVK